MSDSDSTDGYDSDSGRFKSGGKRSKPDYTNEKKFHYSDKVENNDNYNRSSRDDHRRESTRNEKSVRDRDRDRVDHHQHGKEEQSRDHKKSSSDSHHKHNEKSHKDKDHKVDKEKEKDLKNDKNRDKHDKEKPVEKSSHKSEKEKEKESDRKVEKEKTKEYHRNSRSKSREKGKREEPKNKERSQKETEKPKSKSSDERPRVSREKEHHKKSSHDRKHSKHSSTERHQEEPAPRNKSPKKEIEKLEAPESENTIHFMDDEFIAIDEFPPKKKDRDEHSSRHHGDSFKTKRSSSTERNFHRGRRNSPDHNRPRQEHAQREPREPRGYHDHRDSRDARPRNQGKSFNDRGKTKHFEHASNFLRDRERDRERGHEKLSRVKDEPRDVREIREQPQIRAESPEKLNPEKELLKIREREHELKLERELAREKELEMSRNPENSKELEEIKKSSVKQDDKKSSRKNRHSSPAHVSKTEKRSEKRKSPTELAADPPPRKKSNKEEVGSRVKSVYEPSDSEEEKLKRNIGPSIPKDVLEMIRKKSVRDEDNLVEAEEHYDTISSSENDEDFQIGPMPGGAINETIQLELEKRAIEMKLRQLDGHSHEEDMTKTRDEWMTELPDIKKVADFGLGPRQFRTKERPDFDDRSTWTDIPNGSGTNNKKSKTDQKKGNSEYKRDLERRIQAKRDAEQEEIAKRHKRKHKRDKSLLEIHQKKLKKDKKKDKKDDSNVRRPFSRDIDLQVNRFDDAQKKAIIKKSQLLDTRFSQGKSKYL